MAFSVHSRSSEMPRFDRAHMSSYYRFIVTMACLVSFPKYSQILVENREIYIPHLYSMPPVGGDLVGIPQRC